MKYPECYFAIFSRYFSDTADAELEVRVNFCPGFDYTKHLLNYIFDVLERSF